MTEKREKNPECVKRGRSSKRKGAQGEREAAGVLTELFGATFTRGRQFCGGEDSPDVRSPIPGIHLEVKRVEQFQLYPALEQSEKDSGSDELPMVIHRRSRKPWVAVCKLEDLPKLVEVFKDFINRKDSDEHVG